MDREMARIQKEMEAEKEFLEREPKNDYERVLQHTKRLYWESKFKPITMINRSRTYSTPPVPTSALTPAPSPSPPSPPARTSPLPIDYVSEDDPYPQMRDEDLYDFL